MGRYGEIWGDVEDRLEDGGATGPGAGDGGEVERGLAVTVDRAQVGSRVEQRRRRRRRERGRRLETRDGSGEVQRRPAKVLALDRRAGGEEEAEAAQLPLALRPPGAPLGRRAAAPAAAPAAAAIRSGSGAACRGVVRRHRRSELLVRVVREVGVAAAEEELHAPHRVRRPRVLWTRSLDRGRDGGGGDGGVQRRRARRIGTVDALDKVVGRRALQAAAALQHPLQLRVVSAVDERVQPHETPRRQVGGGRVVVVVAVAVAVAVAVGNVALVVVVVVVVVHVPVEEVRERHICVCLD